MTENDLTGSKLDETVISCRNIWKIFGATKKEFETLASEDLADEKRSIAKSINFGFQKSILSAPSMPPESNSSGVRTSIT